MKLFFFGAKIPWKISMNWVHDNYYFFDGFFYITLKIIE